MADEVRVYPGFRCIKRLHCMSVFVFPTSMGCQSITGLPPELSLLVPIYTPGWREALWELSVFPKSTTQRARTWTTRSGDEHTNHTCKATMPLQSAQFPALNETLTYGDHLCGFGQPSNSSEHNLCVSVWIGQWLTWHSLVSCPALRNSTPNWFSIGRVLSHPFRLLALALQQNSQRYCES